MTTQLMEYLPTAGLVEEPQGARKYTGAVAQGYNQKREETPKWQAEQEIVQDMLRDLPAGSWVLDAPCGTGRFFPFYEEQGFIVRGLDSSADMLAQATQMVTDKMKFRFCQGDIRATGLHDKSVDASVMVRMTRWLSPEDCQKALRELQRVTRQRIIFTARVANHPYARPLELFEEVLDGWKVSRNEAGYTEDYRIIMLEPE